tara:strand:+ start:253 stop:420 length:168 start_codon:yes stop_codon:yes gene_type:complete
MVIENTILDLKTAMIEIDELRIKKDFVKNQNLIDVFYKDIYLLKLKYLNYLMYIE